MKEREMSDEDFDGPNIRVLKCPVCGTAVFWHNHVWNCEFCNYPNAV